MPHVFHIKSTDGTTLNLTLEPGTLNGPGSPRAATDLKFYGLGALMWGEGVNQNFYRLLESSACPQKPGSDPAEPMDAADLGHPDTGINKRLKLPTDPAGSEDYVHGQQWFNTTDAQMYYYNGTAWVKTSAVLVNTAAPPTAEVGDLWYDLAVTPGCGLPILKIYDPSHANAAANGWVDISHDRLSTCGGEMSGNLSMSEDGGVTRNRITDLADPIDDFDAVHKIWMENYVTSQLGGVTGDLNTHTAGLWSSSAANIHLNEYQNTFLDDLSGACMNTNNNASRMASDLCDLFQYSNNGGTLYADINNRMPYSGGTFTGNVTINGPGHQNTGSLAATEDYVDALIAGVADVGLATRFVRYFSSNITGGTGGPSNGDIRTSGSTVYVWANSDWRQVYPAVYS